MFRSFVYLDQEALANYSLQLGMSPGFRVKTVDGSLGASVAGLSANVSVAAESSSPGINPIRAYDEFEKKLGDCEGVEYFDFLNEEYDSQTLPLMGLFRFAGYARVPDGFDLFDTMRKFMPFMSKTGLIDLEQGDPNTELAMEMLTNNQGAIPIVIDGLDTLVTSKLKTKWLEGGDSMVLEEIEDDEAIFLCKVVAHARGDQVPVFDPLKDFMRVNRAMRRTTKRSEGLEIVYEKGPVIRAEVVAIYH